MVVIGMSRRWIWRNEPEEAVRIDFCLLILGFLRDLCWRRSRSEGLGIGIHTYAMGMEGKDYGSVCVDQMLTRGEKKSPT